MPAPPKSASSGPILPPGSGRCAVLFIFASKSLSIHSFRVAADAATKEVPTSVKKVLHGSSFPPDPQYNPTKVVSKTRRLSLALDNSDQS
jgi:hypothetical protein